MTHTKYLPTKGKMRIVLMLAPNTSIFICSVSTTLAFRSRNDTCDILQAEEIYERIMNTFTIWMEQAIPWGWFAFGTQSNQHFSSSDPT